MRGWYRTFKGILIAAGTVSSLAVGGSATAQSGQATVKTSPSQPAARPGDIVVEGYRGRKAYEQRLHAPAATDVIGNRVAYGYAERLAKCAGRGKLSDPSSLSAVVDGVVNTATQAAAQDRLVRIYISCSESPTLASFTTVPQSKNMNVQYALQGDLTGASSGADASPLGHSIYDRGALTIEALKRYVPDLWLTSAETNDAAVQARFNARETVLNRHRLPEDQQYFQVAVCMVRVAPELSVRLAVSDGTARFGDLQETLVDRARVCVGGAKKVRLDPTQFRLYIADAVYRWAVAAKGVNSLIPAQTAG